MAENPLLAALIESAHTGDTYSAWTSFTAFITRRLRTLTSTQNAPQAEATCELLLTAMEKVAAPTLDSQMATDLADAVLTIYRHIRGDGAHDGTTTRQPLHRVRTAFAAAVVVEEHPDSRDAVADSKNMVLLRFSDDVVPTVLASSATTRTGAADSTSSRADEGPSSSSLSAQLSADAFHVDERVSRWLEARGAFAQKVLVELLSDTLGGAARSSGNPSATVKAWMASCDVAQNTAHDPDLFAIWVGEVSETAVKGLLMRTSIEHRRLPDAGPAEAEASTALAHATQRALRWCVHGFCRDAQEVQAGLGCVLRCLLSQLRTTDTARGGAESVANQVMVQLAELVHDHLFGQTLFGEGTLRDEGPLGVIVTLCDVDALWRLFPMTVVRLRQTVLPVCIRVLTGWTGGMPPSIDEAGRREHLLYVRFMLAAMLIVQNAHNSPGTPGVHDAYDKVVQLLCEAYAEPLALTPNLRWQETLNRF